MSASRIEKRFEALKAQNKKAFVTFLTAGDPDLVTSAELLAGLPKSGVDLIEIGVPFSDPMADGPAIQQANLRAFKAGTTLPKVLDLVRGFRKADNETPIVLMGYYNPIYIYGVEKFLRDAVDAGVDGLIVVDLPPEEDDELCTPAAGSGLNFIRLITPTTDAKRLPAVLKNASGFLYYVSITGVTGTRAADQGAVETAIKQLRQHSKLPIAIGFGITNPEQARAMAGLADAAVVGSAIVKKIVDNLDDQGHAKAGLVTAVLSYVKSLADAVKQA